MDETHSSHVFRLFWLRRDSVGNVVSGAYSTSGSSNLDSATVFNPPFLWFPNELLTLGYSREYSVDNHQGQDSVMSINETVQVTAGTFTNCIKVRQAERDNLGNLTFLEYHHYTRGIGMVLNVREIPIESAHTDDLIAYNNGTVTPTIVATEEWTSIMDNDTANHGQLTLDKYSDGSIAVNGTWQSVYQGSTTQGVSSSGTMTIDDTTFSMTVQGTATNSTAPVGYQSSNYTETLGGSGQNGKSSGTYNIVFSTYGWPSKQGIFNGTRISGSGITTGVKEITNRTVPEAFTLFQNYPNPFNPNTTISFILPSRSFVSLKVFDLIGREVASLIYEELSTGDHSIEWDAANVPSGVYFYRLQAGSFMEAKKLILLR